MLTFGNDDPWSPSGLKATCNVSALYMLLHGPCARKHRVRAVVIEAVQSVVTEAQQRNDTEKILEAYDCGLHIEILAQDLVVVWTTEVWKRTA